MSQIPILRLCCFLEMQLHATVMNARHRKRCNSLSCFFCGSLSYYFFPMCCLSTCCIWFLFTTGVTNYTKLYLFRKKKTRKSDSFDARGIFKQYGSEEWGDYIIREAHLSQRFVFDENGYYHCCASIPFPENMQVD